MGLFQVAFLFAMLLSHLRTRVEWGDQKCILNCHTDDYVEDAAHRIL